MDIQTVIGATDIVDGFLAGTGSTHLVFYVDSSDKLCVSTEGEAYTKGSYIFFSRKPNGKAIANKDKDLTEEITSSVLNEQAFKSLENLINNVYIPVFNDGGINYGKNTAKQKRDFVYRVTKFSSALNDYVQSPSSVILPIPTKDKMVENSPTSYKEASKDIALLKYYEGIMSEWCKIIAQELKVHNKAKEKKEGPNSELEYWKRRANRFSGIIEQLNNKECKMVFGVLGALVTKSTTFKKMRTIDIDLTDTSNEAKDNVKYLSSLVQFTEPLYSGTPSDIVDALPGLINNVQMIHTISRYYNTSERMTTLFVKITNQMIKNCKDTIERDGYIWKQDINSLLKNLEDVLRLNVAYQTQYKAARDKLAQQPNGKQFDFNELQIFGDFELFCGRVQKLIEVFTTIQQFTTLTQHNIDGMQGISDQFNQIVKNLEAAASSDVLDSAHPGFDTDAKRFNEEIEELEQKLQVFINSSFESISSTENALLLLKKFQSLLTRKTLKKELKSKYTVIFHNYGLQLENIKKLYEKHKTNYERHKKYPPLIRNCPPVAGNVNWCRQLLQKIQEPMKNFLQIEAVMNGKESKKIIKTYNKVAQALCGYEALYLNAWMNSIEKAKAGLNATLLIKHEQKLYVNYDRQILQLIRETKWLLRMGIDVPTSAIAVLQQEQKFKKYFNDLTFIVNEVERIKGMIIPVTEELMKPMILSLEQKIKPGLLILTWSSMNIENYIARVSQALKQLESCVIKVQDIVENRIDLNLNAIGKTLLVNIPPDQSFSLFEFVEIQHRHIKAKSHMLNIKNQEVEKAVEDMINILVPKDTDPYPTLAVQQLLEYYNKRTLQAILHTTIKSLNSVKKRIGSRSSGFLNVDNKRKPFFKVNVLLTIPEVSLNPKLDDVQKAINKAAIAVLEFSHNMSVWKYTDDQSGSFYDRVACDKGIVKVVLLLTGGMHGLKQQVYEYLRSFYRFDYLWKDNKEESYNKFMNSGPTLYEFDSELKRFRSIEETITKITDSYNIGSLSLETQELKLELQAQAKSWKDYYATNMHERTKDKLYKIISDLDVSHKAMLTEIDDLQNLGYVMNVLKGIRDNETEIDLNFSEIEEKYALLARYNVDIPQEETDAVFDLRYKYNKLRELSLQKSDQISQLQGGFRTELIDSVERFKHDVAQFSHEFSIKGPSQEGISPHEAMERLKKFQRLFEERDRKYKTYSEGEKLFGLEVNEYPELEDIDTKLQLLQRLYDLYLNVLNKISGYGEILWKDLDFDSIAEDVSILEAQCKKLPKKLRHWQAYKELRKKIEDFLDLKPLLEQLKNNAMRDRHWDAIQDMAGKPFKLEEDAFKLKHILEVDLLQYGEDVEDICIGAVKEEEIENKIIVIEADWKDEQLVFAEFKHRGFLMLKGQETQDIIEKIEDSQMTLGSMMSSRYLTPFRDQVKGWLATLTQVGDNIEQWLGVQAMWSYLEAVFTSGDIAKQLPAEAKRFVSIDKNWVKIMNKANEVRNVIEFCYENDMLTFPYLKEQLEQCQKQLSGYLETKRNLFPRFYFVSDPSLLEILSQSSDPHSIQEHLSQIFDSIAKVEFAPENRKAKKKQKPQITTMISGGGKKLKFREPVVCAGNVEDWLGSMEAIMQASVKDVVRKASREVKGMDSSKVEDFIKNYPAQVTLLGIQFLWTEDCETAILRYAKTDKKALTECKKKNNALLVQLSELTTNDKLSKIDRRKIETLITIQVHQKDVFDEMARKKVKDISSFDWQKQARFYFNNDVDTCEVKICDIDFEYCNEYLGVKERLVITPLTDRCYITLAQALGMKLGGAPAGPAGTGKTETVKDLARTLGKYIVVFNCSDQMDYRAMGKIYKGLAQSGAWGCFDEFNRILLEVLSVVAQQIACVLQAMKERKKEFIFTDGQKCFLIPTTAMFITMNPGYQGRQELPENLKVLFRGVTMMVPDRQIIIKVKLRACGFQQDQVLSKKFAVLYALCEQQLSKQPHYDFGLRNILSVLRTAGATKRQNPSKSEEYLMMRTLRDMNMSKLVFEDTKLFLSLINDLFPGLKGAEKQSFPDVEDAIKDVISERGLVDHDSWKDKIIQLYETMLVRHGIMVLGPSGGGKSMCYEVLNSAMDKCQGTHKILKMNPKAITAPQMFGKLDPISNDWTDGIFAKLWRRSNENLFKKGTYVWIICDGPVDSIWIENLNTVLDDNKLLTLADGARLAMQNTVKMCFEAQDLNNASPATVSRAGQIYMSENSLGWLPVINAKLKNNSSCESEEVPVIIKLFEENVDACLDFIKRDCESKMDVCKINPVITCFDLLASVLDDAHELSMGALQPNQVEKLFWFAMTWSIGGVLEDTDRIKFDKFMRTRSKNLCNNKEGQLMFDSFVDSQTLEYDDWGEIVPEWEYPGDTDLDFSTLYVPTADSVRSEFLLSHLASKNRAVLFIGGTGTAKTVTVEHFIHHQDTQRYAYKKLNFSSITTPQIFQNNVEKSVEKRLGHTYGPKGGKKMFMFIDDVSMPEINEWGDQETCELVRQLIEDRGFYSLEKIGDWYNIEDVQILAAMSHPGGGKNDIPPRLKRHFTIFNITLPKPKAIDKIYGSVIRGRYNENSQFADDILAVAYQLTDMTIKLWQDIGAKMLPTPSKFHYVFNLRDLSRITQGIMLSPQEVVKSPHILLGLWKHECTRVFCDRLTEVNDTIWFDEKITEIIEEKADPSLAPKVEKPMYFVDFLRDPILDKETDEIIEDAPKIYEPVKDIQFLRKRIYDEFATDAFKELVLFEAALKHLVRISRIIRMPRGNALLVGVGGSGKQSLTKLASHIAGFDTFQVTLTKTYNTTNLFEDLKELYKAAAFKNPLTFIFTDNDIKQEEFLEYINNILSSGEVAGLFLQDELDQIVNEIRPIAKKEKPKTIGKNDTWDNLYRFFINRVRDNLHIVLCFSPVGEKFRVRARKFPGLISGCTIDWFFPWPREALVDVATKFLADYAIDCTDDTKKQLINHMASVHRCMTEVADDYFQKFRKAVYTTPKSFLSFIENYMDVYKVKYADVNALASKVNAGLSKLRQAEEDVKQMKINLAEKEITLATQSEQTDKLLENIKVKTVGANQKRDEVQGVKDVLSKEAEKIAKVKESAEQDLAKAQPALLEAEAALKSIKAADITQLKALKTPPQLIKTIFDGVLILRSFPMIKNPGLMDVKGELWPTDSYKNSLKMMNNTKFLSELQNFDRDAINEETVELLEPYIRIPKFTKEAAAKVSGAVRGLCIWVKAMVTYHVVAKDVAPKMDALAEAEAKLRIANSKLSAKEQQLAQVESDLATIQAELDSALQTKQDLEDDAIRTRKRMEAANGLITALGGERDRWIRQSEGFKIKIARLTGDVAIACAFIAYCGPFNSEFRDILQTKHFFEDCMRRDIPVTPPEEGESFDVAAFLVDASTVGEWNIQGLPTDSHSIQNGIMVTRSSKTPLLVDPQGQGLQWLKNKSDPEKLKVCSLTDKKFRVTFETSIAFGFPMIIENVGEELDPVLDPILERQIVKSGRSLYQVVIQDKAIDYNFDFKLFITTKLSNPQFTPELFAKTTVIDFAVTISGLEQQLLGRVINKKKPELEEQRETLLREVNANEKKMQELEDTLLQELATSQGNLLDNEDLIAVLATTKLTSTEVMEKLDLAKETGKEINAARYEYIPVAVRGSVIYFLIVEMSLVNPMYQTSLTQFLELFDDGLDKAKPAETAAKTIRNIISYLTYSMFRYVSRGLFENHRLLYVILLACKIQMRAGKIENASFRSLLKGGAALDIKTVTSKPFEWLPNNTWLNVINLSQTVEKFKNLPVLIQRNEKLWKHFYDQEAPENEKIPDIDDKLEPFDRLNLIRALREDRTMLASSQFIAGALGKRFTEPVLLDFVETHGESYNRRPLICLLSAGSDPSSDIVVLAKRMKTECARISMGQGQEEAATGLLVNGFETGSWVMLQNCHLGLKFLEKVEEMIIQTEDIHKDFRLWITSEPIDRFPIGLLQMAIKLTNEPPQGIKAGLNRSYQWVTQDMLEQSRRPEWRSLIYTICFLHTIVQERRKFGALGWNIPYEYNQSDLKACYVFLNNHFGAIGDDTKRGPPINWETVIYMICDVQYGGKITDDFDRRLFNTYGKKWLGQQVIKPDFSFHGEYVIPNSETLQHCRDYIKELPMVDNPEVFGLHPNADITYRSGQSSRALFTMLSIQPKDSGGGGGETREDAVLKISRDVLEKIPPDFNMDEVDTNLKRLGKLKPLTIFLKQEIDRFQKLITLARKTLEDLGLAIGGIIIMSSQLRQAMNALYDALVPDSWVKISWKAPNFGLWFTEFIERNSQLFKWVTGSRPKSYWLTGFYNPQGFLTSVRQEITRAHNDWALDDVLVKTTVTQMEKEEVRDGPNEGVYIHGLFIDGASWDIKKSLLINSAPKKLHSDLPVLHVSAVQKDQREKKSSRRYPCPVYKKPNRTDLEYIFNVDLPSEYESSYWVLRGVALLCSKS
mgnify:CR=1 FL=1